MTAETPAARGQMQMWNVVRGPLGRDGVTAKALAFYGSTENLSIKPSVAAKFIKHLSNAGYLLCVRERGAGNAAVWRLKPSMNTGPKPPIVVRVVYDQNRSKFTGPMRAYEALP